MQFVNISLVYESTIWSWCKLHVNVCQKCIHSTLDRNFVHTNRSARIALNLNTYKWKSSSAPHFSEVFPSPVNTFANFIAHTLDSSWFVGRVCAHTHKLTNPISRRHSHPLLLRGIYFSTTYNAIPLILAESKSERGSGVESREQASGERASQPRCLFHAYASSNDAQFRYRIPALVQLAFWAGGGFRFRLQRRGLSLRLTAFALQLR